jgi:hypothetical protein
MTNDNSLLTNDYFLKKLSLVNGQLSFVICGGASRGFLVDAAPQAPHICFYE